MEFDFSLIIHSIPLLLRGAGLTLEITALAVGLGLLIGLVASLAQLSKSPLLRLPAKVYVDCIRGTPLLIQIFIIYFALPNIIGHRIDPFIAAVTACSLNSGAYIAEIFRGGIQGIPSGQYEAGQVLGMTKSQIFFKVTLLQVVKRILPPMGNEIITLVKDTSLANTIANKEIIMMAKEYSAKGLIWPLFSTALFFLVFVGALTLLFNWAEKKLDYFRC